MNDFRFALRQLRKSPGFTCTAIMTLALGIGVNSAIFALVNGVVLRPMVPLRPTEVVNIFTARQNTNHDYRQFSHTEYRELRANGGDLFADFAALEFAVAGIGRDHEMRRSFVFLTSENFFSTLSHPIPPDVLLANREGIKSAFEKWIKAPSAELPIKAPSVGELLDVFCAWVHWLPPAAAELIASRAIIVEDRDT